jgi:hypothetical protein
MSYSRNSSLQSFHGMGALGVVAPPFALMSACDVQLRLITAGKLPRATGADGQWGPGSRTALTAFARARGLPLPPAIGSRGDYQKMADGRLRIPQAIASALPAKANVACGAQAAAAQPVAAQAAAAQAAAAPAGTAAGDNPAGWNSAGLLQALWPTGLPGTQAAPAVPAVLPSESPGDPTVTDDPADPATPAAPGAKAKSKFPWMAVGIGAGVLVTLGAVAVVVVKSRG